MIYGLPYQFAVMYDVLDLSDDNYWQFGLFNFIIDDVLVPAVGSNYTINIAVNYLKDSLIEILEAKPLGISNLESNQEIMQYIAHSHGIYLAIDGDDLKLLNNRTKCGVDLSTIELTDVGFYMFYYQDQNSCNEFIIYTCDNGINVVRKEFAKGTIYHVINSLPFFEKH